MSEEVKPQREKVYFVYMGECQTSDKKQGLQFLQVTKEEIDTEADVKVEDGRIRVYQKKGFKVTQPGSTYEFEGENGGKSIFSKTQRYVGTWHNDDQVLDWQINNRTFQNKRDAEATEKREGNRNLFDETLAPLRERYHKLPYMHRQAFLAAVMYGITK